MTNHAVLLARAYLSRVAEPANVPLWSFVRRHGPLAAVEQIRRGLAGDAVLAATAARRDTIDPAADLEAAERCGARLVVPESDDWPHFAFAALEATGGRRAASFAAGDTKPEESGEPLPPLALWVRGPAELSTLAVRSVGIVGSRAATSYGEHVTNEIAYGLAAAGLPVVSGGAYGIDAAAHRAALAADGVTVIVTAGGVDRAYPAGNSALFARAAESGLLISESPPGANPQRHRFLTRNRLIAALSTGTVVVEAGARSGAANTAKHCITQGRPLMAVPGPVTSALSAGCHDLLRREVNPAVLVTSARDVVRVVGAIGDTADDDRTPSGGGGVERSVRDELDGLDPLARRVFNGLPGRGVVDADQIAIRSGVQPGDVRRALPLLGLAGLVERRDGGYGLTRHVRDGRAKAPS